MGARVKCPVCGRQVAWSSDYPFRPFCGEACKQADFIQWANETYAIPAAETNPSAPPDWELGE